jgi:hypothetical protein
MAPGFGIYAFTVYYYNPMGADFRISSLTLRYTLAKCEHAQKGGCDMAGITSCDVYHLSMAPTLTQGFAQWPNHQGDQPHPDN